MIDVTTIGTGLRYLVVPSVSSFTMAARFRSGSVINDGSCIFNIVNDDGNYTGMRVNTGASIRFRYRNGGATVKELDSTVTMIANSDYFMMAKVNAGTNDLRLNVNGTVTTDTGYALPASPGEVDILGSNGVATLRTLQGIGGEFAIWDTLLSDALMDEMVATGLQGGVAMPFNLSLFQPWVLKFYVHAINPNHALDIITGTNLTAVGSISEASSHLPMIMTKRLTATANEVIIPPAAPVRTNAWWRNHMAGHSF